MLAIYEGRPLTVHSNPSRKCRPRWLVPDDGHLPTGLPWRRFASFVECCEVLRPRRVAFRRPYALGDILMLLPVARALRRDLKLPNPITILVQPRFLKALAGLDGSDPDVILRRDQIPLVHDYGCEVHIDLSKCLEGDHLGGADSEMHRVSLYGRALGVEIRGAA